MRANARPPASRRAPARRLALGSVLLVSVTAAACDGGGARELDGGDPDATAEQDAGRPDDAGVDAADDAGPATILVGDVECDLSGVESVLVPATDAPTTPWLRLRYRVFPSERADAPVVVIVPGGPGQALMAADPTAAFALAGVPPSVFTIVYTDARGSGCNDFADLGLPETDVYSIERVADDLAAIVGEEGLTDYYLYGASFGTTVVTVAAHRMQARGEPLPHRVVLEGIVGRAFDSFEAYFAAFEAEWARVEPMLQPSWRALFATEPWSAELTWTREQWGAFITQQLILGDYPGEGPLLDFWLRGLDAHLPVATEYVERFMNSVPPGGFRGASPMFRSIACRELWGNWRTGREIRDGALRATGDDVCSPGARADYDAADFPSRVPTTYFHGPHDPTTTTEQAEHHFVSRRGAERDFVTVPDASHAPLTLGLAARGCAEDVWAAIAGERDLAAVLLECERGSETIELRSLAD